MPEPTFAVVGATGIVGRQIISALERRDVDSSSVFCFATERSAGEELDLAGDTLEVEALTPDTFRGKAVVLLAVPAAAAQELAPRAKAAGAWVVDVSGAHRLDASVPLVAAGFNDAVAQGALPGRVVGLAHPVTQAWVAALEPLRQRFGLAFADATVLLGAASKGRAGVDLLSRQTGELMNGKDPEVAVFPHRLAFNVIPGDGDFERGLSGMERQVLVEAARLWTGERLPALTCTALTVPTYHGATLVLSAHLEKPADAEAVRAALREGKGLKLLDQPAEAIFPMPMLANDDDAVHVGRVRAQGPRVQLVACVDNAYRAAAAAVDLALALARRA